MSKIKKIGLIKNMATFNDFEWDKNLSYVDNKGKNCIYEFSESNTFYGRNGTGKTTVSRILRALETGRLSNKYKSPEFCVEFDDGSKITQNNFATHNHCIRVFNEDFINENLKFFIDENANISPFAVLGDDNARIEAQIEQLESEIGSRDSNTGLYADLIISENELIQADNNFFVANKELEDLLENKSNDRTNGIRYQPELFGDQNYNKQKLNNDITTTKESNCILSNEEQDKLKSIIKEESKNQVSQMSVPRFFFSELSQQTKELVERQITISDPIQELLNDNLLQNWVYQGMSLHKNREICAFCHNPIPADLWEKLSKHFNQESENLQSNIKSLITRIEQEKQRINNILIPEKNQFYSEFYQKIGEIYQTFQDLKNNHILLLDDLIKQLKERAENITYNFDYKEIYFNQNDFVGLFNTINEIIEKSNNYTNELSSKKSEARKKLRLNEVAKFVNEIRYENIKQRIEILKSIKDDKEREKQQKLETIQSKQNEISELKSRLNDEQKGAEKVNELLTHFLTGQNLCLKAIESLSEKTIRFEIFRNNEKAHNLSEGERTLIAFCYFIAKLSDLSTQNKNPIIFIDDPICSLDSNHIFFIFSLIESEIIKKIKDDNLYSQLFISTHNLDFFKYLKSFKKIKTSYFLIEKNFKFSTIKIMPIYLQKYATEFNYLFENIYKCANITSWSDDNYHILYNFGNNARKFLEIYMYYQYPIVAPNIDSRLEKFFDGDNVPAFLHRINNEYSHLDGGVERGAIPIDYMEAKLCAKAILDKIEEKNPEQFQALKDSIGA
ncbi:AAA family ATPase [Moraxella bovoculi]|uniref:AAA family ATPase n=1 Tax=Moraxella bovoculi TaxID=386891 RepID=UPI000B09816A|nr:AAA family ATPase [Moraxella bovoculi]